MDHCASESDKRPVNVRITVNGLELLTQPDDDLKIFESNLRNFSKEEIKELNRLLDKLPG